MVSQRIVDDDLGNQIRRFATEQDNGLLLVNSFPQSIIAVKQHVQLFYSSFFLSIEKDWFYLATL